MGRQSATLHRRCQGISTPTPHRSLLFPKERPEVKILKNPFTYTVTAPPSTLLFLQTLTTRPCIKTCKIMKGVTVTLTDGSELRGVCLVAADGVRSSIAAIKHPEQLLNYLNVVLITGFTTLVLRTQYSWYSMLTFLVLRAYLRVTLCSTIVVICTHRSRCSCHPS